MEIHRPKAPIHGLRELAKEIGIIVIGVLIAIAFEQAAEWLHWRERAAQAEVQMRGDASFVLGQMVERQEIQACQDRLLTRIRDRLLASGPDWTPMAAFYTRGPPKGSVYAHPMKTWPDTAWRNAVASTAATHIPDAKLAHFARIFAAAERSEQDQAIEHEAASELNTLDQHLTLTPDGKLALPGGIIAAERCPKQPAVRLHEAGNSVCGLQSSGLRHRKDKERAHQRVRSRCPTPCACSRNGLTQDGPT